MRLLILSLLISNLFSNTEYIKKVDFLWLSDTEQHKNSNVILDDNTSMQWMVLFNKDFSKKYAGQVVKVKEVYEAEFACWNTDNLKGTFSNDYHLYTAIEEKHVNENYNYTFGASNTWCLNGEENATVGTECDLYATQPSHDKIHVFINDTLFYTFEFTLTPKGYKPPPEVEQEITQEPKIHIPYTKPDYSRMYAKTPQIILPKTHIYDVQKLSYFRGDENIILVEASSGNFAIPREEFKSAHYLLLTQELKANLSRMKLNPLK